MARSRDCVIRDFVIAETPGATSGA